MAKKKDLSKNLTPIIKKKPINTNSTDRITKKVYKDKKMHQEQRYTINMPVSVYNALKDYAHDRGASMKFVVVEAVREKIGLE